MLHINFNTITLHNFGSYQDAKLNLQRKGFCLVSGQNNCIKDNAASNGSGKSLIWNAICYALSGETVNGLTKGLKNINTEDTEMYVELSFSVNADQYVIRRGELPAKYLRISKNDVDVSGKTYTESLSKFTEFLPDITRDLITSVIILGQAMPNKFSSLSAVDKKQRLEQLFKADYMIEDIKNRVSARQSIVAANLRTVEDNELIINTKLSTLTSSLTDLKLKIAEYKAPDYDAEIKKCNDQITLLTESYNRLTTAKAKIESELEIKQKEILKLTTDKSTATTQELTAYNEKYNELYRDKTEIQAKINSLNAEIKRLESITDICPTCGQKLPGVERPKTDQQRNQVAAFSQQLTESISKINSCNDTHAKYVNQIATQFDADIALLNTAYNKLKSELNNVQNDLNDNSHYLEIERNNLTKLTYERDNAVTEYHKLVTHAAEVEKEVTDLTVNIKSLDQQKIELNSHVAVLKKMESLIKRDFRGYLLTNIINYINKKAKDFSEIVFKTRDLDLALNGTSLDITYCGKLADNLSGGEKTRVDLIMQLAIRATLMTYLGFNSNILVLDEITDFLDAKSCSAVMDLLNKEVNTVESVFIISHRASELSLPIDTELTVIKDSTGNSTIC